LLFPFFELGFKPSFPFGGGLYSQRSLGGYLPLLFLRPK
jgi:hypothetical protein